MRIPPHQLPEATSASNRFAAIKIILNYNENMFDICILPVLEISSLPSVSQDTMWMYGPVTAVYCHAYGAGKNSVSPVFLLHITVTNNGMAGAP